MSDTIRVRCYPCYGEGTDTYTRGIRAYKITCRLCGGRGYRDISPFELDPVKDEVWDNKRRPA